MSDGTKGPGRLDRLDRGQSTVPVGPVLLLGYATVVTLLVVTDLVGGPLRIVLVAPLLGFLPGYALLYALFPSTDPTDAGSGGFGVDGLQWAERGALAVGVSVVLLVGIVLVFGGVGLPLTAATIGLALFLVVAVGLGVGTLRGASLSGHHGTVLPFDDWRRELRDATTGADSRLDAALTVVLVVVVALALTGFAYGLTAPDRSVEYTEVALLNEQGDDLVASNYTTSVAAGDPVDLTVTIENHEGARTNYTVAVVLERVRTDDDGAVVLERQPLDSRILPIADGETRTEPISVRPDMLGQNLRLSVFVVDGAPSGQLDPATADHHLYLWIDVTTGTSSDTASRAAPSGAA